MFLTAKDTKGKHKEHKVNNCGQSPLRTLKDFFALSAVNKISCQSFRQYEEL